MSKVIVSRLEYACFDDAAPGSALTAVPPTYPPTLDQYSTTTCGNTGAGYGVVNVSSTGAAFTANVPSNAGVVFVAPTTNTTMVSLTCATMTVPNGTTGSVAVLCGPGQTVSIPTSWPSMPIVVAACNATGSATITTAFAGQMLWSY